MTKQYNMTQFLWKEFLQFKSRFVLLCCFHVWVEEEKQFKDNPQTPSSIQYNYMLYYLSFSRYKVAVSHWGHVNIINNKRLLHKHHRPSCDFHLQVFFTSEAIWVHECNIFERYFLLTRERILVSNLVTTPQLICVTPEI